MGNSFSERERKIIREALLSKGRELFSASGIKKTSVEELSRSAGIAKGSFYRFFGSKEELFFEILEIEEGRLRDYIKDQYPVLNCGSLSGIIKDSFRFTEENPIIRIVFKEGEYQRLLRKLPEDRLRKHIEGDNDFGMNIINSLRESGDLIDRNSEFLSGVLRALFFITLHKKEIGQDIYPEIENFFIDTISAGITEKEGNQDD